MFCSPVAKAEVGKLEERANSLRLHYNDIIKDGFLNQSDIICIQETWLVENIKNESEMFQHFYINKKSKGIAILTKIEPLNIRTFHSDLCSIIKASYPNFDIINVYRFSENKSKEKIEEFTIQLVDFIDG